MNRFERAGITQELIKGRKVIICGSHVYTSHIFYEVLTELEQLHIQTDKVSRANGLELIQVGEGELSFARSPEALRGKQADIVLFSSLIRSQDYFRETWWESARPVIQTSDHRYTDVISG